MTVLYIIDYGTKGGATVAFVDMVCQMSNNGITPIVVTGKYSQLNESLEDKGIKTVAAGHYTALEPFSFNHLRSPLGYLKRLFRYWFFEVLAYRRLCKKIDFNNIDLIHTNSARNTIGCRLAKKYSLPHVMHIREFGEKDFKCIKLMPNYIEFLNRNSTVFVSVSKSICDYWNRKGIDESKNRVIYDGVNNRDIEPSPESKRNDTLKMLIVGGVVKTKGQHLAVQAIGLLPEPVRRNVHLDVYGWGNAEYIKDMKQYAINHGYANNIEFKGAVNDIHQRLKYYDVGLMCSRSEGFGLVTAEYMHAGLGVIASNSGACPEIVDDGVTGLLFESGNPEDLAKCIQLFYNDRNLLESCGMAAKQKAKQKYTDEINSQNIRELYKELTQKKDYR